MTATLSTFNPGTAPNGLNQTWYSAARWLNAYTPLVPWQVFYSWIGNEDTATGTPGIQANNPLNIAYAPGDPNLSRYGVTLADAGNNEAAFPSISAGAEATAALLTESQYSPIIARASEINTVGHGSVLPTILAIQASPWAASHYNNSGIMNLYNSTFGGLMADPSGNAPNPLTGSGSGSGGCSKSLFGVTIPLPGFVCNPSLPTPSIPGVSIPGLPSVGGIVSGILGPLEAAIADFAGKAGQWLGKWLALIVEGLIGIVLIYALVAPSGSAGQAAAMAA